MSLSMKYLFTVSLLAGLFEAASAFFIEEPLIAAHFAVVFLGCAFALWRRESRVATALMGLFLPVDVGGVPFYAKESVTDWVVQLAFGAVGLVGLVACVAVLRSPRAGSARAGAA
jgi:hypothetical protein